MKKVNFLRFSTVVLVIIILMLQSFDLMSQNITITDDQTYTAHESAMLDVKSTTKGLLIPRLTTTQRESITPLIAGLLVFDTNEAAFYYYDGSNWIDLSRGQIWTVNTDYVLLTDSTSKVGIGTYKPNSKLEVKADASFTDSDTLFSVKDKKGNIVFAVFPDGAAVYVNQTTKGKVGGFAVSGRNPSKATEIEYLRVTPDSTRVWVNNDPVKGKVGGFAVSGRNPSKDLVDDYMVITPDSARIYINDTIGVKGKVGGFAVSGRNPSKGISNEIFLATVDSTRIYVDETNLKGKVGGFAVSGRNPSKGAGTKFMDMSTKNYLIGQEAGSALVDGLYNSFMGYQAGKLTESGSKNIFLGYQSGLNTRVGFENIFIGYQAGFLNTAGNWNTFLGTEAGLSNTGSDNTFIGYKAGRAHLSKGGNVYIGSKAGSEATMGEQNVYIGESTGQKTTYGKSNVLIGFQSGFNITGSASDDTLGSYNVYMGYQAGLMSDVVFRNVFLGYKAGMNTIAGAQYKDGSVNVFIGSEAGYSNTTGQANSAIGDKALYSNTTGDFNVALGRRPLRNNISGSWNVSIGNLSLFNNETGDGNVALGSGALGYLVSSDNNVAVGTGALALAQDSANVGVGPYALGWLVNGANNTAIGPQANVILGGGPYNNTTAVGNGSTISQSNQIVIGNDEVTSFKVPGAYNANTSAYAANLYVSSTGEIMRSTQSTVTGTGSSGRITFWNGTNTISSDSYLYWNNTSNRLGINNTSPSYTLDVAGTANLNSGVASGTVLRSNGAETIYFNGSRFTWGSGGSLNYFPDIVSVGTTDNTYQVNIKSSIQPLRIWKVTDGTLIRFATGTTVSNKGSISVSGGTVSYNAFTGSHYANVTGNIEKGMLIALTGDNNFINNDTESEIIYGGVISTEINSKYILGAYLSKMEEDDGFYDLVMAVGNGVMWVVDNGDDLQVGDYLISSSTAGHAMKDKGEFEVSNIIGRVAEPVEWANETEMIDGVKHKLVSVFFENFTINNTNMQLENKLLQLEKTNAELMERLQQLENKLK